jgi:hypothetical protein
VEHLISLASEPACGEALVSLVTTLLRGDMSNKVADLLSSATPVISLKKDVETIYGSYESVAGMHVHSPKGPST